MSVNAAPIGAAALAAQQNLAKPVAYAGHLGPRGRQCRPIAWVIELPRGTYDICREAAERLNEIRDHIGAVLTVAVHDAEDVRLGAEQALNAGLGQPSILDSQNEPDPLILKGQVPYDIGGTIRGVVVNEDDLPVRVME